VVDLGRRSCPSPERRPGPAIATTR
jgi:hypothetical protein